MIGKCGQLAVVLVAGMMSVPALAQERRERPERPQAERQRAEQQRPLAAQREGGMTTNLVERLDDVEKRVMALLTEDQKKQAEAIFKQAREQVTALQADLEKLEVQRRELTEKAMEQTGRLREELAAMLTPEQRRAMREALAGAGGPMGGVLERLQDALRRLDLTEAQQQKLAEVRENLQARVAKLRESAAGDRQAMMEGMRELMQDLRPMLRDILTPEQMEKIGGALGGGPGGDRPGAERRER